MNNMQSKPVILTGIRANNDLHIGNYFGALLPIIDMATNKSNEFTVNLFLPDLHSFTTPIDHSKLKGQILQTVKLFAAAGLPLNNPDVHLYRQSYISAHSELTWILDCFTGFGEMSRMTQFKDKTQKMQADRVSVGLFNYPVLMAADILLYNANYVPVGDDQTQHIEYARDIAQRLNTQFGQELLVVPEPVKKQHEFFGKDQGLRIMDLQDPRRKMSKSEESGKGVIFLTDDPSVVRKKIMSAATDDIAQVNYDLDNQPGVSNLLQILALLRQVTIDEVVKEFANETSYGTFKTVVADEAATFLTMFQQKLAQVDDANVLAKLAESESTVRPVADATLLRVQTAVGLR